MRPRVKICGLNDPVVAGAALDLGASYGGIIGYPESPRCPDPESRRAVLDVLPRDTRVYVDAEPPADRIEAAMEEGYGHFQIHFDPENWKKIRPVLTVIPPASLWLAPRFNHFDDFDPGWLAQASGILVDGFSERRFGGTGKRVVPLLFQRLSQLSAEIQWILAGGISPENCREVVGSCAPETIDVNSGIETTAGVKSVDRMRLLFQSLGDAGFAGKDSV